MRLLKIVGGAVGVLVAAYVGGYALPRRFTAATSVLIDASPSDLFEILDSADGLRRWWSAVERPTGSPRVELEDADGPLRGVGTRVAFMLDGVEGEIWEIVESTRPTRVEYAVDFRSLVARRVLTLEPEGDRTRVSWSEVAQMSGPVRRYLNLLLGKDDVVAGFDAALRGLKAVAEGD